MKSWQISFGDGKKSMVKKSLHSFSWQELQETLFKQMMLLFQEVNDKQAEKLSDDASKVNTITIIHCITLWNSCETARFLGDVSRVYPVYSLGFYESSLSLFQNISFPLYFLYVLRVLNFYNSIFSRLQKWLRLLGKMRKLRTLILEGMSTTDALLTCDRIITNWISFCAWHFHKHHVT